jgi:hypothetical protein
LRGARVALKEDYRACAGERKKKGVFSRICGWRKLDSMISQKR